MIDLAQFVKIDRSSSIPFYLQICNSVITLIENKILYPDVQIQPTRDLANCLKTHRKTVVMAYDELVAQGWLRPKARCGYFVASVLPNATPISLSQNIQCSSYSATPNFAVGYGFDELLVRRADARSFRYRFNDGFPDVRLAPLDAILSEYTSLGKRKVARQLLGYSAKEGAMKLRKALASDLRKTRGMPVSTDNLLVTRGAQHGISLIASFVIRPADSVIVGKPGYFVANLLFKRLGAELFYVPVDELGINVDEIEKLCNKRKVRLVYVIPHHHHPTTVTLSPERRLKLVALAERFKFIILEDDFDFDIHYANKPVLPIASVDRSGSVIYVGTLSKILAPAIRVGYVAGPEQFIALLAQHKFLTDMQGDTLMEEAIAELFINGTIERHLKKIRRIYRERRDIVVAFLRHELSRYTQFNAPEGGMSVWTTFKHVSTKSISAIAERKGLMVCDGTKHNVEGENFNSVSLGFASMNAQELQDAMTILKDAIRTAAK